MDIYTKKSTYISHIRDHFVGYLIRKCSFGLSIFDLNTQFFNQSFKMHCMPMRLHTHTHVSIISVNTGTNTRNTLASTNHIRILQSIHNSEVLLNYKRSTRSRIHNSEVLLNYKRSTRSRMEVTVTTRQLSLRTSIDSHMCTCLLMSQV